jgi:hypothetical protein
MTGCGPAELLAGGRAYFDALCDKAAERRRIGWDQHEMLASLAEISFAQYRTLLALSGAKEIPDPLRIRRPGEVERKRERISWRDLKRIVSRGGH